jgi:hypothetical protein
MVYHSENHRLIHSLKCQVIRKMSSLKQKKELSEKTRHYPGFTNPPDKTITIANKNEDVYILTLLLIINQKVYCTLKLLCVEAVVGRVQWHHFFRLRIHFIHIRLMML